VLNVITVNDKLESYVAGVDECFKQYNLQKYYQVRVLTTVILVLLIHVWHFHLTIFFNFTKPSFSVIYLYMCVILVSVNISE